MRKKKLEILYRGSYTFEMFYKAVPPMAIQLPKGTFDILPYDIEPAWQQSSLWHLLEQTMTAIAQEYGYQEIRTPIYERTALFDRGVGETTDIVSKEMFTFEDKGGRSLSLRPEGTASVARAFIEHQLQQKKAVHKLFYMGPMFRYERPQSGRYRQFHQFGVEVIGVKHPEQDAEVIDMLYQIYTQLGLKNLHVKINSVGDLESRSVYRQALIDHFTPHFDHLSKDSQERLQKNPLRILDSKDPKDAPFVKEAPSILDYLSPRAKKHFEDVRRALDTIDLPYEINERIVRGLDYYTDTVFEILTHDLGAQNALGGGGRYDALLSSLGGPDLPGVGFAIGLERVAQTLIAQKGLLPKSPGPLVYFIPLGEEARLTCFSLATSCRHRHLAAEVDLHAKKVQAGLQQALDMGAAYAAVIGSEELEKGIVTLKHLSSRQTVDIKMNELLQYLQGAHA